MVSGPSHLLTLCRVWSTIEVVSGEVEALSGQIDGGDSPFQLLELGSTQAEEPFRIGTMASTPAESLG